MAMARLAKVEQWSMAGDNGTTVVENLEEFTALSARREILRPNSGENEFEIYRLEESSDKLLRSFKYADALEELAALSRLQTNNLKTLMKITECIIFLNKFDEAFKFIKEVLEPVILKSPPPDAKDLIAESQSYRQLEKFFRSLNYIWCACAVYQAHPTSRESLKGIVECMRDMEKLLVQVFEKHGVLEYKDCARFAEIHIRHLKQLGKMKKSNNLDDAAMLGSICQRRIAGIASCYLLLQEYHKSIECFQECVCFPTNSVGLNKLKFGLVGNFVATVASCLDFAEAELEDIAAHIVKARKDILEFGATGTSDIALKNDVFSFMEDYAEYVKDIEKGAYNVILKLLRLFFRY